MEALLDGLERQLAGNAVSIAGACQRLTAHLQQATMEDIKSLHVILPDLMSTLLYNDERRKRTSSSSITPSHTRSWLTRSRTEADYGALFSLLKADGPLFSLLLANSTRAVFEVPLEHFPEPAKTVFKQGGKSSLPSFYRDRLVQLGMGTGNVQGSVSLRLDMAEYFLYHLFNVVSLPKETASSESTILSSWWPGSRGPKSRPLLVNDVVQMRDCGRLPIQFDEMSAGDTYLGLVDDYLSFLVPLQRASTSRPQIYASRFLPHASNATRLTEYTLGLIEEILFNQQSYDLDIRGQPISTPPYQCKSVDYYRTVIAVTAYLQEALLLPAVNMAVQSMVEQHLPMIRVALYKELRLSLSHWPTDATMSLWMEAWMTAAFPWRSVGGEQGNTQSTVPLEYPSRAFADFWSPLVRQDYYLYQTGLDDLLDRLAALMDGYKAHLDKSQVDLEALLDQTCPLMAALLDVLLNTERLADALRSTEQEAMGTLNRTPLSRSLAEQLAAREPLQRYRPGPLFQEASKTRALEIVESVLFLYQLVQDLADRDNSRVDTLLSWLDNIVTHLGSLFTLPHNQLAFLRNSNLLNSSVRSQDNLSTKQQPSLRVRMVPGNPDGGKALLKPKTAKHHAKPRPYEVGFLVGPLEHFGDYIDAAVHSRIEHVPFVSDCFRNTHISLRFLARPGNLIFCFIVMAFSSWLSVRLLFWILFAK